jgi:hypothetical protein
MRDGVIPEVQLAPPPARPNAVFLIEPFAVAVNLQTCEPLAETSVALQRDRLIVDVVALCDL